ncbi:hypothetical protein COV20_02980 [Candidatus Woesearchaeota archaeon CG10_big_fil_rev_8_21_14_0_10_45_16]|nr:MAG: hypothetical protein COV20_02980 [Candidatus Woesearchaeota archaeon CG10_big_fil_rev_8_21_14_0_10_45_16]
MRYKNVVFWVLFLLLVSMFSGCSEVEKDNFVIGISPWSSSPDNQQNIQGFKKALADQGFMENIDLYYIEQNAQADIERQLDIAENFQEQEVDLIYSLSTQGTLIMKAILKDTPLVFSSVPFPVETSLIGSLEQSGNNLVGTRNYVPAVRQFRHFLKILPEMRSLAFVSRVGSVSSFFQKEEFKLFLEDKNIDLIAVEAVDTVDLKEALASVIDKVDAVYTPCDALIQEGGDKIVVDLATQAGKPVFSCSREVVDKGGLLSVTADQESIGYQAGLHAAKILKGARPTDLPTRSSTEDDVIINQVTARKLNLEIPGLLLAATDEVIG